MMPRCATPRPPSFVTGGLLLFAAAALAVPAGAQDVLLRARRIVVAPDTVLENGALLLRGGKVAYVGAEIPAEAQSGAELADYGVATISPGFVLAQTTLQRDKDLGEAALPFTPDLLAVEAFDPWQEELLELPRQGITSLALAPSQRNVAGGIATLVKPGAERGTVAVPELYVSLSLSREARSQDRAPTSLMGARDLLREAFATARQGVSIGPDTAVLRQAMAGSRRIFVHADSFAELSAALDLATRHDLTPVLVGAREADKLLDRLAESGAGVVLDTLRPEARLAELELPAKLARAGVPFCFGGQPERLRLSAVLAVRHGLDRKTALQALTRSPATLLGQQQSVGSLRQGCAADFVVFRGDLLDLGSPHVATWIDGARVFGEAPRRATPAADGSTADGPDTDIAGER